MKTYKTFKEAFDELATLDEAVVSAPPYRVLNDFTKVFNDAFRTNDTLVQAVKYAIDALYEYQNAQSACYADRSVDRHQPKVYTVNYNYSVLTKLSSCEVEDTNGYYYGTVEDIGANDTFSYTITIRINETDRNQQMPPISFFVRFGKEAFDISTGEINKEYVYQLCADTLTKQADEIYLANAKSYRDQIQSAHNISDEERAEVEGNKVHQEILKAVQAGEQPSADIINQIVEIANNAKSTAVREYKSWTSSRYDDGDSGAAYEYAINAGVYKLLPMMYGFAWTSDRANFAGGDKDECKRAIYEFIESNPTSIKFFEQQQ